MARVCFRSGSGALLCVTTGNKVKKKEIAEETMNGQRVITNESGLVIQFRLLHGRSQRSLNAPLRQTFTVY